MLPIHNKTKPIREIQLGDESNEIDEYANYEMNNYKLNKVRMEIKTEVLEYFKKYPTFKNGLFTNLHICKVCNIVEKLTNVKINKKELVIEVIEIIAERRLTKNEKQLIASTIDYLHSIKQIKVSYIKKLFQRLKHIFR